jgi:hypothetical protein
LHFSAEAIPVPPVEEEVKLRIRTVGPGGGYRCGSSVY